MPDYKLSEVKYFGKWQTYNLLISDKHVTISDNNGDGRLGKGDTITEGQEDVFKKYRKVAQTAISRFRRDLPGQLKMAVAKLKDAKVVRSQSLPGQVVAMPSMRDVDGFTAVDFNSDGRTDMVEFTSTRGTHIEIQKACLQTSDVCNTKAIDGFLKLFDN